MADETTPTPPAVDGRDGKVAAWDPKLGTSIRVDPAELHDKLLKGDLRLVDADYPMVTPGGEVRMVPAGDVGAAIAQGGYRFGAHEDVLRADARTGAGQVRTMADGAVNRATMGFGDALQTRMGVDPDAIRIRAEENPKSRFVGEVLGAGVGAAAMGSMAPGALASEGLAAGLSEGAATFGGQVATTAGGAAVEGAVHGVGDAVSEAALGRTDATAESLLAHGGLGFALGGVLGGVLSVPGAKAVRADDVRTLMEGTNRPAARSLGEAYQEAVDAYHNGPAVRAAQAEVGSLEGMAREAGAEEKVAGAAEKSVSREASKNARLSDKELAALQRAQAGELAAHDAGFAKSEAARERLYREGVGALDKEEATFAKRRAQELKDVEKGHAARVGEFESRSAAELKALGKRQAEELKALEKEHGRLGTPLNPAEAERRAQELAQLQGGHAYELGNVQELHGYEAENLAGRRASELEKLQMRHERSGQNLAERRDFFAKANERRGLDEAQAHRLGREALQAGHEEALAALREQHLFRGSLDEADVAYQAERGAAARARMAEAESGLPGARGALESAQAENPANAPRGGIAQRGIAYAIGHAIGGPGLGFVAENLVGGANPVRLSALARAGRVVDEHISDRMLSFVAGSYRKASAYGLPRAVAPTTLALLNARSTAERRRAMADRMDEITRVGDPASVADRATAGVQHVATDAPDVAAAISAKTVQAMSMLQASAPMPLVVHNPLAPRPSFDSVSDRDVQRFAEIDATIQDPLRIVDHLAAGRMPAPEAVDAVRSLYPRLFERMSAEFQRRVAEHPGNVPYSTVLRAGIVFGVENIAPSIRPDNLAIQQSLASAPPAQPGQGSKPGGRRPARPTAPRGSGYLAPSSGPDAERLLGR